MSCLITMSLPSKYGCPSRFATPLKRAGALVLDVREPSEYVNDHVPGAKLVPLGSLPDRIGEFPRHECIYVFCASGNRSRTSGTGTLWPKSVLNIYRHIEDWHGAPDPEYRGTGVPAS